MFPAGTRTKPSEPTRIVTPSASTSTGRRFSERMKKSVQSKAARLMAEKIKAATLLQSAETMRCVTSSSAAMMKAKTQRSGASPR